MLRISCTLIVTMLVVGVCGAQWLSGDKIRLEVGDHTLFHSPVTLVYKDPVPEGTIFVVGADSEKSFRATIRGGEFVFVPDIVAAGSTHTYLVKRIAPARAPLVDIKKQEGRDVLEVRIEDKLLTAYYYSNDQKKPYLWPLNAEGGVTVTRDWPMGEKMTTQDHPHQKSFWTAYGNVNGADCWTEGENSGYQHSDDVTFGSGDAYGWIYAKNTWQDKEHKSVLSEEREYRFYTTGSADPNGWIEAKKTVQKQEQNPTVTQFADFRARGRLIDVTVKLTAAYGDALFKDTKEGGLVGFRIRDDITEKAGQGIITNAGGGKGMAACWGKPSEWCDYSGAIEGTGMRGVAVFDHPDNFRHPTCWHVRDYGLMGANCFGLAAFTNGAQNGDHTLKSGESLTFRYRIYVHSGNAEDAKVADRYADYAKPPRAEWAK
ncbi:MAG: PmoA family protein [Candidatus Hydrogenedentes bacterium]|nr:PmoA family protein [Candidatus Hydrogenedentota bacterium]